MYVEAAIGFNMKCSHPYRLENGLLVGCGSCPSCSRKRSNEWCFRVMNDIRSCRKNASLKNKSKNEEAITVNDSIFYITLTYKDQYLPIDFVFDDEGEVIDVLRGSGNGFLYRPDVVNFNKRLRIRLKREFGITDVRVCYSGEYGEEGTHRPHFHLVIWNVPLELEKFKSAVDKAWSSYNRSSREYDSFGHIKVEQPIKVSDCVSYVTKAISYVTKNGSHFYCRQGGEKVVDFIERTGKKTAPFLGFSKGMGLEYIEENYFEVSKNGFCVDNGFKVSIPRYYQNKCMAFLKKVAGVDKARRTVDSWLKKGAVVSFNDYQLNDIGEYLYYKWYITEKKNKFRSKYRKKFLDEKFCSEEAFNQIVNCVEGTGRVNPLFFRRFLESPIVSKYFEEMKNLYKESLKLQENEHVRVFISLRTKIWLEQKEEEVKQGALNDLMKFKIQACRAEQRKFRRCFLCLSL